MKKVSSKFSLLLIAGISVIGAMSIQSCSKSGGGNNPPVITPLGGYTSSDAVASANLVAYWPFDGNANDTKGGMSATAVGSPTFTSGLRGQAYQGSIGTYFTVPANAALAGLQSYSVSLWYKMPAQDTLPQGLLFMSGTTQQAELINEIEPYTPLGLDSVRVHTGFVDVDDPAPLYQYFIPQTFDTLAIGKWVHFVVTYDGGSSTFTTYQDANQTACNSAFSNGGYMTPTVFLNNSATSGGTPLGNIGFTSDPPVTITLGSWPDGLFGQVAAKDCFLGQMDEFRIYNKALTQLEVAGLFLNGQAGR